MAAVPHSLTASIAKQNANGLALKKTNKVKQIKSSMTYKWSLMMMRMMIFMQIRRRIRWLAASLRIREHGWSQLQKSVGVRLGSIVFLAPVSLALNQ